MRFFFLIPLLAMFSGVLADDNPAYWELKLFNAKKKGETCMKQGEHDALFDAIVMIIEDDWGNRRLAQEEDARLRGNSRKLKYVGCPPKDGFNWYCTIQSCCRRRLDDSDVKPIKDAEKQCTEDLKKKIRDEIKTALANYNEPSCKGTKVDFEFNCKD